MPTASPALTPEELERSLRRNMWAGFCGMFWMTAAVGVPLPLLMRAIGASGFQLGLLAGTWQLAMLAQIASALIVERLPRRKPFWASVSITHRCLWCIPALLPVILPEHRHWWPWVLIGTLAIANMLGQSSTASWQSWMADLLPASRAGRFWGERHRIISVGLAIASLLYGFLLDREYTAERPYLGFQIVFWMATIFGVSDILIHLTVYEPEPHPRVPHQTLPQRMAAPFHQPDYLRFTLAMGVWVGAQAMLGYSNGLPGFFSMVYLKESFSVSYAQAAFVFFASAMGAAIWTPLIGRFVDRWGGRRVLLFILLVGPLTMMSWLPLRMDTWHLPGWPTVLPQPVLVLSIFALVLGGLYAGSWMCQMRLTQALTVPSGRTLSMALHWTIVGVMAALGPVTAGLIKDHFHSAHLTYYQLLIVIHIVLSWGVVLPLVWSLRDAVVARPVVT